MKIWFDGKLVDKDDAKVSVFDHGVLYGDGCFEGIRFYDLQRIARHKNEAGLYGSDFGSIWFADKLKNNNPQVDLTEPKNWYLPF